MKWSLTAAWALFALEATIVFAWVTSAWREVGRDPGERVWTTVFTTVPTLVLSIRSRRRLAPGAASLTPDTTSSASASAEPLHFGF